MIRILRIILEISDSRDRRLLALFLCVSLLATSIEVSLIFSLSLFVGDLEAPSNESIDEIQLALLLSLLFLSMVVQISNIRLQAFTATSIGMRWSTRVLKTLYSAQYRLISSLKGADVINFSVTETSRFTDYVVLPMLQIFSRVLIVTVVSVVLFLSFPVLSVFFLCTFSTIYIIVFFFARLRLNDHSARVSSALEERNNIVLNSFLNLKLTLIKRNIRDDVLSSFAAQGDKIVKSQSFTYTFVQFPRYVIEFALLFLGAMLFYFGWIDLSFVTFAFAGFRILPHVQAIYAAFASLHSANSSFENVAAYFKEIGLGEHFEDVEDGNRDKSGTKVEQISSLSFDRVNFKYGQTEIFKEFSFEVDMNSKPLMIVGRTGSGKSTLIDLISGLYPEHFNNLRVNGVRYTDLNVNDFQSKLFYIPQMFFCKKDWLSSYMKKNNSSLEDPRAIEIFQNFDLELLIKDGQIRDLELEENFKNLSGGQRQRLMLALTILNKPKLLILDEATNALDRQTEENVLNTIISQKIPMVMITHHPVLSERFTVLNLSD